MKVKKGHEIRWFNKKSNGYSALLKDEKGKHYELPITLDDWIIEIHRIKSRLLSFNEIVDSYCSFFAHLSSSPSANAKSELSERIKKLVNRGELKFEEGKTYLKTKD